MAVEKIMGHDQKGILKSKIREKRELLAPGLISFPSPLLHLKVESEILMGGGGDRCGIY